MYNDPRLKNTYHVWFSLYGFDSHPDEITKQLGTEPTEIKVKGEFRTVGKKKPVRMLNKENIWILDSGLPRKIPVEKQLENLLDNIRPYKQNFIKIVDKYSAELNCAVYYYEANPGINLDKKILKEITELNLPLGLDIYCLAGTILELEQPKVVTHLTRHLEGADFISKYDDIKHNELNTLVNSLKEIENASSNIVGRYMHDLIWNYKPEIKDLEQTLKNISGEIRRIFNEAEKSKLLSNLIKGK